MIPLTPRLSTLLAQAAMGLLTAPQTGARRLEAEARLSTVLLVINGAPFMFKGPLSPDAQPYPGGGVDPLITRAREVLELPEAEDTPADLGRALEAGVGLVQALVEARHAGVSMVEASLNLEDWAVNASDLLPDVPA